MEEDIRIEEDDGLLLSVRMTKTGEVEITLNNHSEENLDIVTGAILNIINEPNIHKRIARFLSANNHRKITTDKVLS